MYTFLQNIIDFIFPPSNEELHIRYLPIDWLPANAPNVSNTEFPFIRSLFSYKDKLIRELIWQIKYKKNKHAIKCAGYALYKELCEKYSNTVNTEKIILIPIPISKSRRKERGYNQCELLIDEIIHFDLEKRFSKDFNILIRIKDIEKQTFKNRNERISNINNIFNVIKIENTEQKLIIIDDVTTTGSTLKEAYNKLTDSGYTRIEALTIAH